MFVCYLNSSIKEPTNEYWLSLSLRLGWFVCLLTSLGFTHSNVCNILWFLKCHCCSNQYIFRHVQVNNEGAIDFYKKFGFEIVETKEHYYKRIEPADAHVLQKTIRQPQTAPLPNGTVPHAKTNGHDWAHQLNPLYVQNWSFHSMTTDNIIGLDTSPSWDGNNRLLLWIPSDTFV